MVEGCDVTKVRRVGLFGKHLWLEVDLQQRTTATHGGLGITDKFFIPDFKNLFRKLSGKLAGAHNRITPALSGTFKRVQVVLFKNEATTSQPSRNK